MLQVGVVTWSSYLRNRPFKGIDVTLSNIIMRGVNLIKEKFFLYTICISIPDYKKDRLSLSKRLKPCSHRGIARGTLGQTIQSWRFRHGILYVVCLKKAYKGGVMGTPGPFLATPLSQRSQYIPYS